MGCCQLKSGWHLEVIRSFFACSSHWGRVSVNGPDQIASSGPVMAAFRARRPFSLVGWPPDQGAEWASARSEEPSPLTPTVARDWAQPKLCVYLYRPALFEMLQSLVSISNRCIFYLLFKFVQNRLQPLTHGISWLSSIRFFPCTLLDI